MDEYLFISMAKLGADRVRKEREDRSRRPLQTVRAPRPGSSTGGQAHSLGSPQLPVIALGLAIVMTVVLGAAAVSDWYGAAYGYVPNGEVYITDLSPDTGSDVKVAQNSVASVTR